MNNQIFNRRVAEQFKNVRLLWDKLFFPFRNKKNSHTTRSEDDVVQVCRNHPKSPISLKEVPRNNNSYPEKEFRRKPKNRRFLRIVHLVLQIFMWVFPYHGSARSEKFSDGSDSSAMHLLLQEKIAQYYVKSFLVKCLPLYHHLIP